MRLSSLRLSLVRERGLGGTLRPRRRLHRTLRLLWGSLLAVGSCRPAASTAARRRLLRSRLRRLLRSRLLELLRRRAGGRLKLRRRLAAGRLLELLRLLRRRLRRPLWLRLTLHRRLVVRNCRLRALLVRWHRLVADLWRWLLWDLAAAEAGASSKPFRRLVVLSDHGRHAGIGPRLLAALQQAALRPARMVEECFAVRRWLELESADDAFLER